jgi:CheY-like chemotaxis protein
VAWDLSHPTILIVHEDKGFRDVLTRNFQPNGYLVLEAEDAAEALDVAVRHSRRIHLLLADDTDDARDMAAKLNPYQPFMKVLYIRRNVEPALILSEILKVLEPAGHAPQREEPVRADERIRLTAELDEARRRFLKLSQDCLDVAKGVPSGIPHPDGVTRIERLGAARRRAYEEFIRAQKKLDDYITSADTRIKSMRKHSSSS